MTGETLLVFGILLVAILLFLSNRIRLDLVAILVIATLMLTGLLSPRQALSGFGDPLVILMPPAEVVGDNDIKGLQFINPDESWLNIVAKELGLAEILLTPRSELIGRTLEEVKFREHHGVNVLGVLRKNKPIVDDLSHLRFKFGDSLLIGGHWHRIRILEEERSNFVAMNLPEEMDEAVPVQHKSPLALVIILGMLILMTFNVLPAVTAVILAALAMVFTKCIRMKGVYEAINWQSLVLIAGMLPMATALEQTGGIDLMVNALIKNLELMIMILVLLVVGLVFPL